MRPAMRSACALRRAKAMPRGSRCTTRRAAAVVVAICMAIPATAHADSDAAQLPGARTQAPVTTTFPSGDFRGGAYPADHPGMSRAQPAATTIEVVLEFPRFGGQ
jgi:hypothetical protein